MTATKRAIELFELGGEHDSAGRERDAGGPYREVVAANPAHRAARMFLALCMHSDGQGAAAVHELLDLLLTDPGPPERYRASLRWYADDLVGLADPDD